MDSDLAKPWYASQTIWGGIAAIAAGLGGAYYSYSRGDINGAMASLMAAFAGVNAVVGRFRATMPIGKPSTASVDPAAPALKGGAPILLAAILALAFVAPALAASRKMGTIPVPAQAARVARPAPVQANTAPTAANDPVAVIQKFTVSDLQNALADAATPISPLPAGCSTGELTNPSGGACVNDPTAAACYTALIPYVQANVNNPLPTKLGAFLAFQKARDLKVIINQGIPAAINNACAPLVLDAANTILGLANKIGLGVAAGAINLGIGGLPFGL